MWYGDTDYLAVMRRWLVKHERELAVMATFNLEKDFNPLIKDKDTLCFGCSPSNDAGLKMTFLAGKDSLISRLMVPVHLCGWKNIVHGGILSTILDETMSWSAIYLLKQVVLTTRITVDFMKPVIAETWITSQGKVLEQTSDREVVMEGAIFDSDGELCTSATGKFRVYTPEAAKKFKLMSAEVLDQFDQFIRLKTRE